MSRVIAYTRVSTREQADDGHSLTEQHDKIQQWAALHDHRIVETCEDAGHTGGNLDRPGLNVALEMLTAGDATTLAVYKLDRLARSTSDLLTVLKWFKDNNYGIVFVREQIDTNTPAGKMMLTMLATIAEFELDQIRERTRTALASKKERGEWVGRPPLGMLIKGQALTPDPAWDNARAAVQSLRERGLTLVQVAEVLPISRPDGRPWTKDGVRRVLRSVS